MLSAPRREVEDRNLVSVLIGRDAPIMREEVITDHL
jgi:hypothetical protein